ncbi:MAG: apolipoprotein N-acyltransferase, partial [Caulobacteraceae bacterium]
MAETSARGRRLWIARLAAVFAGAAAAFAQPPWGFLTGLLGYGLMLWLVDRSPAPRLFRSAFFRGWLTGLGYFVVSVWWIAEPFQIDAREQGWMAPFAVAGVSMFMALFWGAAALGYRALAGRSVARVLLFAAALSLAEWLRGHVLTGFPWDLPGETWAAGSAPSQTAALVGAYGLTWITLAVSSAPAVAREGWRGRIALVLAALTVAGLYGFGALRLARAPRETSTGPRIRVVQADVKQENKYDQRRFADIVGRYVRLTARPSARLPDIVVWPEGAIPAALNDYLAPGAWTHDAIAGALSPGQTLLLGGYRYGADRAGRPVIYN